MQSRTPSATLLSCGPLRVSRDIHITIGSESSTLSRRATPRCVTCQSPGHRSCRPMIWRGTPRTRIHPPSDLKELADKGPLHTTDDDIVLLVCNRTPPPTRSDKPNSVGRASCLLNDEPVRITFPCSCPLGSWKLVTRRPLVTLAPRARCACWSGFIGGLARTCAPGGGFATCLERQARKNPWLTVCWPIILMTIPEGPGVAVSVDYFIPFRSHHEATPTSCCSPIASVVEPTCSPSMPLSSPRRVQPIS